MKKEIQNKILMVFAYFAWSLAFCGVGYLFCDALQNGNKSTLFIWKDLIGTFVTLLTVVVAICSPILMERIQDEKIMDHIKRQCMFVFAEVYNELQRDIKDDPNFPEPNYVHLAKSLKGISFDQAHSLIFDQKEAEYFYKMNKGMRQIFDYQEKTETIAGQNELRFIGFPTKAALMAADCALALSKAKGPAADKFIKFAQKHITVSSKHLLD